MDERYTTFLGKWEHSVQKCITAAMHGQVQVWVVASCLDLGALSVLPQEYASSHDILRLAKGELPPHQLPPE